MMHDKTITYIEAEGMNEYYEKENDSKRYPRVPKIRSI